MISIALANEGEAIAEDSVDVKKLGDFDDDLSVLITATNFTDLDVDVPVTGVDLLVANVDLPVTNVDLTDRDVDLSVTGVDLPVANVDLLVANGDFLVAFDSPFKGINIDE